MPFCACIFSICSMSCLQALSVIHSFAAFLCTAMLYTCTALLARNVSCPDLVTLITFPHTGVTKKLLPLLARPPQSRTAPRSLLTAPLTLGAALPSTLPTSTTHNGTSLPSLPASNNTPSSRRPPLSGNTGQHAPHPADALTIDNKSSSQQQGTVGSRMPCDDPEVNKSNQQSARPFSFPTADDRHGRQVPAGFQHVAKSGQGPRSAATTAAAAVRQATSGEVAQGGYSACLLVAPDDECGLVCCHMDCP